MAGGLFSKISEKKLEIVRDKLYGIIKQLLTIGADFGQPKDFQDVFSDVLEKFVDPLRKVLKLDETEAVMLCQLVEQGFYTNKMLYVNQSIAVSWDKFMKVITCFTEVMYKL